MNYWVYVHVCPNGKRYVGVTTHKKPEYRWGRNGEGYKGQLFGKAVRKYGWSSITHEVFEVDSKEEMYYAEKYLIAYYHTTEREFGYNLSSGGEKGALGCIRSEETREKCRLASQRKAADPKWREKQRKSHLGKVLNLSFEERKRRAEFIKNSPSWKKNHEKGRKLSEEHKKHIGEGQLGHSVSVETREKLRTAKIGNTWNKGKVRSKETKGRMSEAAKNRPRIKIKLPDGTILERTKPNLVKNFINKGKKFEYVS